MIRIGINSLVLILVLFITNVASAGGPDCISCHDIRYAGGEVRLVDFTAMNDTNAIHRNLNNGTVSPSGYASANFKCWACHGNGTEPESDHPINYLTPYFCENCHGQTSNLSFTNISLISNLTTKKVINHVPSPVSSQYASSIKMNSSADCKGCHDKSKVIYSDSGYSHIANVSHYASMTNLVIPTINWTKNCDLCHRNSINAFTYWANLTRHPAAKTQDIGFCDSCHYSSLLSTDFHSSAPLKVKRVHYNGFNWSGMICSTACHGGGAHNWGPYKICEDCHLPNGSGPYLDDQADGTWLNESIPRVYAHTNFSKIINVPNQSGIYVPPDNTKTFSSCYSFNNSMMAGTCHAVPIQNISSSGGYFSVNDYNTYYARSVAYHDSITIDRMPNTTNCVFCHNQTNPTIRFTWGNSTQITGGTHNWYIGNDNSKCWNCHVSTGSAPKDFHSESVTGGGGTDCIACHVPADVNISKFSRHANLNTSDGTGNVSNNDCWTCHYQKDMNRSHVYLCDSCHKNSSGIVAVNDSSLLVGNLKHGSNSCKSCHAPDMYHSNGTVGPLGRVENPGWGEYPVWGLISPIDNAGCHDCHRTHNGLDEPFHGPGIGSPGSRHIATNSLNNGSDCSSSCHTSNTNPHNVKSGTDTRKPTLSVPELFPSTIIVNNPVDVTSTGSAVSTSTSLQIEAAQYRLENSSGQIIIDWTAMNATDGRFNSSLETINATINTIGLIEGNYNVSVRVMASGPRTNTSLTYYPLNGDWSDPLDAPLVIEQPKGFINGTVRNGSISGTGIHGVTVRTNTDVSTLTDSTGFYSLRLPNGTYTLTATKDPEYYPNMTIPLMTVTADHTEEQDIIMIGKPTGTISGVVTN